MATPAINSAGCTAAVECSASAVVEGSDIDAEDVARLLDRPRDLGMLRKMMKQALALGPLSREQEGDRHDTPSDRTRRVRHPGIGRKTRTVRRAHEHPRRHRGEIRERHATTRRLEQHVDPRRGCRFGQDGSQIDRFVQPKPVILPEDQIKIA